MKVEDIKSTTDLLIFIEGLLNDFESGISDKDETMKQILSLFKRIIELREKQGL